MKKLYFVLAFIFLSMNFVSASDMMYIKKVYSHYRPTGPYILTCKFYHKKVEITEFTGDASSIRFETHPYIGPVLGTLVAKSYYEHLVTTPFNICDGGSLSVRGYRATGHSFALKLFEDCGPTIKTRQGPASKKLRNIAQQYCPSYDPSMSEEI